MTVRILAAALALLALAAPAAAQDWPSKPVRVVAPFAPGGSADTLGRLIAQHLTESFKQQFVVENRPGAGGVTGSAMVARAAPDGYMFVISGIASHVVAPAISKNVEFDPMRDFTHVALLGGPPTALVAHNSLNIRTLADYLAFVKAQPEKAFYASPGAGTHGHLFGEFFAQKAGVKLQHVPYKGAGAAVGDLIANQVPFGSITLTTAAPHIRSGVLVGVAVTAENRVKAFPDVPTFKELGHPDLVATTWFAVSGPAGLPAEIVRKMNGEIVRILQRPDIQQRLEQDAIEAPAMDPDAVQRFFVAETARWTPVAKASGAKAE